MINHFYVLVDRLDLVWNEARLPTSRIGRGLSVYKLDIRLPTDTMQAYWDHLSGTTVRFLYLLYQFWLMRQKSRPKTVMIG